MLIYLPRHQPILQDGSLSACKGGRQIRKLNCFISNKDIFFILGQPLMDDLAAWERGGRLIKKTELLYLK